MTEKERKGAGKGRVGERGREGFHYLEYPHLSSQTQNMKVHLVCETAHQGILKYQSLKCLLGLQVSSASEFAANQKY